jgi:UDP-N-acetylglucosamine 2-epimerase (non-hydrolysing)
LDRLLLLEPLGYRDFLKLLKESALVITDSGGVQEESTFLGIPCLTVRENTERPVTTRLGTNRLVGRDPRTIVAAAFAALDTPDSGATVPELWDGRTAVRILNVLRALFLARPDMAATSALVATHF